jgi:uncharacterized phage protein (TIGR01671 family)
MTVRPHKYRFWDADKKEWIDVTKVDIYFQYDANSPTLWSLLTYVDGKKVRKNLITHQSTGLFDDNSVEIMEGDIVWAYKANSNLNGYYKVVWDNLRGRWAYMNGEVLEKYQVGKSGNTHCKILGNEFDNPKLNHIRKL